MTKYVRIGADILNLESITRILFVENQSGISDRIIIEVGGTEVVIDSEIGGRDRMNAIRDKLLAVFQPEIWEAPVAEMEVPREAA